MYEHTDNITHKKTCYNPIDNNKLTTAESINQLKCGGAIYAFFMHIINKIIKGILRLILSSIRNGFKMLEMIIFI